MESHSIYTEQTAHYYSFGKLGSKTKELWIVCHGYGQLASFFIQKFKHLNKNDRYIVAPEGLNRFYIEGFEGRVGANWMTKEKRLDEINDYCKFIEKLTNNIMTKAHYKCKIITLGFSQGTTTISRWLLKTKFKIDSVILWGGKIGNDFDYEIYNKKHQDTKNYIVFGIKDEFYSKEMINNYKKKVYLSNVKWIIYSGGHSIHKETLGEIVS